MSPVSKRRKKKTRKPPRDKRREMIPVRVHYIAEPRPIDEMIRDVLAGKHREGKES